MRAAADAWALDELRATGTTGRLIRLACPHDGALNFARMYAYFRWADDRVDQRERATNGAVAFIEAERLRLGTRPGSLLPQQAIDSCLADGAAGQRLMPHVAAMLEAVAFDAARGSEPIRGVDLERQTERVGDAYLGALWVCAGEAAEAPPELRWLSRAATAVHTVRDLEEDLALGYCNVSAEHAGPHGAEGLTTGQAAPWCRERLALAESWFARGRAALPMVRSWRTRALLSAYTWRYERVGQALSARYRPRSVA